MSAFVVLGTLIGVVGGLYSVVNQPRSIPASRPSVLEIGIIMVLCGWTGMFFGLLAGAVLL